MLLSQKKKKLQTEFFFQFSRQNERNVSDFGQMARRQKVRMFEKCLEIGKLFYSRNATDILIKVIFKLSCDLMHTQGSRANEGSWLWLSNFH